MGRCLSGSCMRRPLFNIPRRKTAVYFKQHSERGMIDVRNRRCSHSSWTRLPNFGVVVAKKTMYCMGHAKKGMVDILTRRCAHESCTTKPSLGVRGSKKAVYCKQHATKGMVDVSNKRCSHEYCVRWPRWGVLTDASPSTCGHHKSDLTTGTIVDYRQQCNRSDVDGCLSGDLRGSNPPTVPIMASSLRVSYALSGLIAERLVCLARPTSPCS